MKSKLLQFRIISLLEGLSFLILLFVAMPMKYIYDNPIYVKYVGMTHGVLFLLFVASLYLAKKEQKWSKQFTTVAFITSLVPFGTIYLELTLRTISTTR